MLWVAKIVVALIVIGLVVTAAMRQVAADGSERASEKDEETPR